MDFDCEWLSERERLSLDSLKKDDLVDKTFSLDMEMDVNMDTFWESCPNNTSSNNTILNKTRNKKSVGSNKMKKMVDERRLGLDTCNELDVAQNPYLEVPMSIEIEKEKVEFVGYDNGVNVHKYTLYDKCGGYDKHIVSISALLKTFKEIQRFGPPDENMEIESGQTRLQIAISEVKRKNSSSSGYRFNKSIGLISKIFTDYLNSYSDPSWEDKKVLSFNQRRQFLFDLQDDSDKKDIVQFLKSETFECFEQWILLGCPTFNPFVDHTEAKLLAQWVFDFKYPKFEHIEHAHLRAVLQTYLEDNFNLMTGNDVERSYKNIPCDAGTYLHNYLEFRLTDSAANTKDAAKLMFQLREPRDYIQAEDFIEKSGFKFIHVEQRLSSYRHRICGSVDAISSLPDGTLVVHDHKRTPKFNDKEWFKTKGVKKPKLSNECLSSELVKYAIQMAGYRKLLILNGTVERPVKVSNFAYLHIFHPSLRSWGLVEIDLEEKMMCDGGGMFGGLGVEKYGEAAKTLSPIELTELLFEFFECELRRIYRLIS